MRTNEFLDQLDDAQITAAIAEAEAKTSGEIRIFVSRKSVEDPLPEAERQFLRLGMEHTRERNGVLIFFAPKSQTFAVVGDIGVHSKCGKDFWEHIATDMLSLFKEGKFTDGVLLAIREVGEALARYFPPGHDDRNELSNEIARD